MKISFHSKENLKQTLGGVISKMKENIGKGQVVAYNGSWYFEEIKLPSFINCFFSKF